jgi:hypothetical protein
MFTSIVKKVESSIVNGTDGENSNEYGSNQIVLNSNSEENFLLSNDTSVNSNHVVIMLFNQIFKFWKMKFVY